MSPLCMLQQVSRAELRRPRKRQSLCAVGFVLFSPTDACYLKSGMMYDHSGSLRDIRYTRKGTEQILLVTCIGIHTPAVLREGQGGRPRGPCMSVVTEAS